MESQSCLTFRLLAPSILSFRYLTPTPDSQSYNLLSTKEDRPVKLGFFATGSTDKLDFAEFAKWGAENGYQAMDVPPTRPGTKAICERYGLQVVATSGIYGAPLQAN